jgi:protein O-GlcNAc transferase
MSRKTKKNKKSTPVTPLERRHDIALLWQRLRHSAMQPLLWFDLAGSYAGLGFPWQAGYAARQALRCDATLLTALQALVPGAWQDTSANDALLGSSNMPEASTLAASFRLQVERCAGDWLSWLYLARLQEMSAAESTQALLQAQALEPVKGESLHWMGVWRLNAGDAQNAVAALSRLLDIRPVRFGSMMYLGEALLRTGNIAAAEKAFARASHSTNPEFLQTLSARVYAHNYWQEALDLLNKALLLKPDNVPLLLALAKIQSEVYSLADCSASLGRVKVLQPDNKEARLLDAGLQGRMGDARGHLDTLQTAYESGGDPLSRLASSVAMTMLYHDLLSPADVADWHRRLCAPIMAAVVQKTDFSNLREPRRRLRIGYVTGDLHRQHPVNIFMLPVLLRHDHAKLEIFIYHTGTMHDEYTRQAKACADHWLEALKHTDLALQQAIVADKIDILIDLAGHTSTHRLGVFALRAAPVQATFLGYPHSTGLSTIDWLVGDAVVSPAQHTHLYSEGIAQLPGSVFCWAPVDDYPLPLARAASATLVFGSFNNAMKLTPQTIALWANVLKAVPDSQLLLKAPSLRDAAVQARFAALFSQQGIARDRLLFRGPSGLAEMMQEYGDIDIGLDPTPYNGGTTTLQALWMGVPVVALTGGNFVSRMGASFMHTLGKDDWVAHDEAAYIAIAVRLAAERVALRSNRAQLREQMAGSALCDIQTYVSNFETLLQKMWTSYCAGQVQRVLGIE